MAKQSVSLFCGDCLEVMKSIPDHSVDMVLCDPPYSETRAKWDTAINWTSVWESFKRITKTNGAIVIFGNEPLSSCLRLSQPDLYRYDWKWIKNHSTGFANSNYRPMRSYEDILVFSKANASAGGKSNSMIYNPQGLVEVNKKKINRNNRFGLIDDNNKNRGGDNIINSSTEYTQKYTNYPNNLLYFDVEKKRVHPTQKPVELLEYLIKTYTHEGMTVLDNFMGSGSTGVACLNTGRKFIGIEKDEHYFEVAKERIEAMQKQSSKEQQERKQKQAQNDYDEQEVEFTDETLAAIDEIDALFDHSDDVD